MNPPSPRTHTDEEVKRLASLGEMISAIKLYRQIHHVGLKQAKDAVEALAGVAPAARPTAASINLSTETQRRLEILFPEGQRLEAVRLLTEECGNNLPLCQDEDEAGLERIRFAALKLSGGDLVRLRDAVQLAKTDWRDLLMAAEFAHDPQAHQRWIPKSSTCLASCPNPDSQRVSAGGSWERS